MEDLQEVAAERAASRTIPAGITQELSRFIAQSNWNDIPADVRHEATRTLLHWIGCTVGGAQHDTVDRAVRAQLALSRDGNARLFGRAERLHAAAAAFVNGIASHVLDFDDTQLGATNVHPTGPVASALFALAEVKPVPGAQLLHALVLGIEVECRLANSVFATANRGWHVTGAVGGFGAAAACGKLLDLDAQQLTWALGTVATQVVGLREMFGSMCKSLHTGRAADNGLVSAMLAAQGYTSTEHGIEGRCGYAQVVNGPVDLAGVTADLGKRYELAKLSYKPFACGIVVHPTIEACLEMRKERPDVAGEVTAVALRVHPDVLEATGKKNPASGLESKFSVYHAAAVALLYGVTGEEAFSDGMAADPRVAALRSRVSAAPDAGVRKDEVYAAFALPGGTVERHIEHVVGSVARPMTDGDLTRKFETLAAHTLGREGCARLIERAWNVAALTDVRDILATGTTAS